MQMYGNTEHEGAPQPEPGFCQVTAEHWAPFMTALTQLRTAQNYEGDIYLAAVRIALNDPHYEFQSPFERGAWKTIGFTIMYSSHRH